MAHLPRPKKKHGGPGSGDISHVRNTYLPTSVPTTGPAEDLRSLKAPIPKQISQKNENVKESRFAMSLILDRKIYCINPLSFLEGKSGRAA
jgi:hypothetical protein